MKARVRKTGGDDPCRHPAEQPDGLAHKEHGTSNNGDGEDTKHHTEGRFGPASGRGFWEKQRHPETDEHPDRKRPRLAPVMSKRPRHSVNVMTTRLTGTQTSARLPTMRPESKATATVARSAWRTAKERRPSSYARRDARSTVRTSSRMDTSKKLSELCVRSRDTLTKSRGTELGDRAVLQQAADGLRAALVERRDGSVNADPKLLVEDEPLRIPALACEVLELLIRPARAERRMPPIKRA